MLRRLIAGAIAVALSVQSPAQEAPVPAASVAAQPMPYEDLVGWYNVTVNVRPGSCRLKSDVAGEWHAIIEAGRGRRGLVLHLEQLNTYFSRAVLLTVNEDGTFASSETMPLDMGVVTAPARVDLKGKVVQSRRRFEAEFAMHNAFCALSGTLSGERTDPPAPALSPGASLNSDGFITPLQETASRMPPSPLIKGDYSTVFTIEQSRCAIRDMRGSWQRTLDLTPKPGIEIPLQNFNDLFAGPVMLDVDGLSVHQTADVQINGGLVKGAANVTVSGGFNSDATRLVAHFVADHPLCRLEGTITANRQL